MIELCDRCDNILNITRKKPNYAYDDEETPNELSSETDELKEDEYVEILKKLNNDETIEDEILKRINIKDMIQTEYYKKMNGKGALKKKLLVMIEELDNSDGDIEAYYVCENCNFYKKIESGASLYSDFSNNMKMSYSGMKNESNYRMNVHSRVNPSTRHFRCPNDKCLSRVGKKPSEAVIIRESNSYRLIHVCRYCKTIKLIN